jgi:hypothetical protein
MRIHNERNDNRNPGTKPRQNRTRPPKRRKKPTRKTEGLRPAPKPRLRRNRRHHKHRKHKKTRPHNSPRRQRGSNLTSTQVITSGKRHTILRQTLRQSRAHPLQKMRKTRLPRTQETMRSLRLRRNLHTKKIRVANQDTSKTESSLKVFCQNHQL